MEILIVLLILNSVRQSIFLVALSTSEFKSGIKKISRIDLVQLILLKLNSDLVNYAAVVVGCCL